jgi:hypothetical protein
MMIIGNHSTQSDHYRTLAHEAMDSATVTQFPLRTRTHQRPSEFAV